MFGDEGCPAKEEHADLLTVEKIPAIRVELTWENPPPGNNHAMELRGALASRFPENPLFHQHRHDKFIYRYPLIQYRWAGGKGVIVGFHQGAMELVSLPWLGLELRLGETPMRVREADISCKIESLAFAAELQHYRFRSPWLAINQRNYEKYGQLSPETQAVERSRILVGNLLSAAKGLGVFLNHKVLATFQLQHVAPCRYKEQALLGFFGTIAINLHLPEDLAIGGKVSHGFGWLTKLEQQK